MSSLLVPFGATGWSYLDGVAGHSPGFENPAYDVSGWPVGDMAFGGIFSTSIAGHPRGTVVAYATGTGIVQDLCVRRNLGPNLREIRLEVAADDGVRLWLNGVQVYDDLTVTRSGGPTYNNVDVTIDDAITGGENVLAIRRRDLVNPNGGTWLDVRVSAIVAGWKIGAV